jgi:hypothetical protein
MRRWCCQGRRFISSPTARFLTALKNGAAFTPTWTVARVRRPVGAGRPALVDRATADQAADPPPAAQHRSAVPAGGDRPGRLKPNGKARGEGFLARPSWVPPASHCQQDFEKLALAGMAKHTALGPYCWCESHFIEA